MNDEVERTLELFEQERLKFNRNQQEMIGLTAAADRGEAGAVGNPSWNRKVRMIRDRTGEQENRRA